MMAIGRETPFFVDASCLIAAAGSPTGGSAFILRQCQRGLLRAIVSAPVCDEAERNVRTKLPSAAMAGYLDLLRISGLEMVPEPTDTELARVPPHRPGERRGHAWNILSDVGGGPVFTGCTVIVQCILCLGHGHAGTTLVGRGGSIALAPCAGAVSARPLCARSDDDRRWPGCMRSR